MLTTIGFCRRFRVAQTLACAEPEKLSRIKNRTEQDLVVGSGGGHSRPSEENNEKLQSSIYNYVWVIRNSSSVHCNNVVIDLFVAQLW